ncbi:hypothetical protein HanPSC8_Chr04g0144781 [Helianthus annuus]|nr:hypothetical protein HanPSC8_Chr04g0144781 [Helianthus annuus]
MGLLYIVMIPSVGLITTTRSIIQPSFLDVSFPISHANCCNRIIGIEE